LLRASIVSCRTRTGPIILYTFASSASSFNSCRQAADMNSLWRALALSLTLSLTDGQLCR
jgi:hypothetical protein